MKSRVLAGLFLSAIALCILSNSARAQLYVSQQGNGTVGKYDATTGAAVNASFITGTYFPVSLALLSNTLFVGNNGVSTVSKFDATTGAGGVFFGGVTGPVKLALFGNNLFVSESGAARVSE